jgi:hypothetical protein
MSSDGPQTVLKTACLVTVRQCPLEFEHQLTDSMTIGLRPPVSATLGINLAVSGKGDLGTLNPKV